ncbi:hypothetical protein [Vagococcus zengguangii]|uniref:hypothetical protein n=1 Tax=Vagococcus zengguangii TaxID=2571750 RepID=UPI00110810AB|nr:hypothetical protein [Vagococcus zengguangii]TLG80951.1 hypothetical protein FE258_03430 [Vagococcus zengguangii]
MIRIKSVLKNISYTITSNLISLIVSTIVTLFLPKILGVSDYGYYQLYTFYVSYVGFLHFGWCDGMYLRYGGQDYETLSKDKFKGQFISLLVMQIVITLIFLIAINTQKGNDIDKFLVLLAVGANIVILNMRNFILLLLQSSNRIKDYSFITIIDRMIFLFLVLILLALRVDNYYYFVIVDIIGKLVSFIIAIFKVRDITPFSNTKSLFNYKESIINITVGINLMFANIASMLIIGIVRFGIQYKWSVETFGKISLTLSISNLLMVFVNAISLAMFPILKKVDESKYKETYPLLRTILMPAIFILLLSYYPISLILGRWLPQYEQSLRYMAIAFPIVVFDSKVGLITNTFLKALRREKDIFKVNLITAILSLLITGITVFVFESIELTVLSIVILVAIRGTLAEKVLGEYLKVSILPNMLLEYLMVAIFIIAGWFFYGIIGCIIYFIAVCLYLFIQRKAIKNVVSKITNKG